MQAASDDMKKQMEILLFVQQVFEQISSMIAKLAVDVWPSLVNTKYTLCNSHM